MNLKKYKLGSPFLALFLISIQTALADCPRALEQMKGIHFIDLQQVISEEYGQQLFEILEKHRDVDFWPSYKRRFFYSVFMQRPHQTFRFFDRDTEKRDSFGDQTAIENIRIWQKQEQMNLEPLIEAVQQLTGYSTTLKKQGIVITSLALVEIRRYAQNLKVDHMEIQRHKDAGPFITFVITLHGPTTQVSMSKTLLGSLFSKWVDAPPLTAIGFFGKPPKGTRACNWPQSLVHRGRKPGPQGRLVLIVRYDCELASNH